jgi:hypothetical protein
LHKTTDPREYCALLTDILDNKTPEVQQTYQTNTKHTEESLNAILLPLQQTVNKMAQKMGVPDLPRFPLQSPPPVANRIALTAPGKHSNTENKTRKTKNAAVVKNKPPVYDNVFTSEKMYNQLMQTHKHTHLKYARKPQYLKRKAKNKIKKAATQRVHPRLKIQSSLTKDLSKVYANY